MIKKSITKVVAWALQKRPPEYIQDLRDNSIEWNTDKDFYFISEESWNKLATKYGGKPKQFKDNSGRCPYAIKSCCGEPPSCMKSGADCQDPFNKNCVHRT